MDLKFVRPRFHYDSYTDFWKLVELSDFDWCWLDEIDLKKNCTYILSPIDSDYSMSYWTWRKKNARIILWDLERPKPRGGLKSDKKYLHRLRFDEIWHSDAQLAKDLGTRFVILGSDERLGNKQSLFKKYNIVHMSYENGRRGQILLGIKKVAPNGWGKLKDKHLRKSKFGLSIHQDNDLYSEPLRFALFASYALPIISESVYDAFPITPYLLEKEYKKLPSFVDLYIRNYSDLKNLGNEIKQKLCVDYRFKNVVDYAIKEPYQ